MQRTASPISAALSLLPLGGLGRVVRGDQRIEVPRASAKVVLLDAHRGLEILEPLAHVFTRGDQFIDGVWGRLTIS